MKDWIEGFQASIDYIEQNLTEELDIEKISKKAALSSFYYQRIFGAMCGMTVGEYIRVRRMTLAAEELSCSDHKVIDIAVKYPVDIELAFRLYDIVRLSGKIYTIKLEVTKDIDFIVVFVS